jgi:hypothetical protein
VQKFAKEEMFDIPNSTVYLTVVYVPTGDNAR